MSASFRDIGKLVSANGATVLASLGRSAPTAELTARDLAVVTGVAARRTAAGVEYARGISDLGGTDLWTELARGFDARTATGGGASGSLRAMDLIGEARDVALPRWKGVTELVQRPRPWTLAPGLETVLAHPHTTSFPSGHTTGAYVGATIMATLDPAHADHYWAAAIDTARSRVYGGVHFPSDVEVGARLGHGAAVEVLARHGIVAAAMRAPSVSRIGDYASYGVGPARDALAALAELRIPDPALVTAPGSGVTAARAAVDEMARLQRA